MTRVAWFFIFILLILFSIADYSNESAIVPLKNERFINLLSKNIEQVKTLVLEPQCVKTEGNPVDEIDFSRREIFLYDYSIFKNDNLIKEGPLEIYFNDKTKEHSSIILTFYLGNLYLNENANLPYEISLKLYKNEDTNSKDFNCKYFSYDLYLLKNSEVYAENDVEPLGLSKKFTIGKSKGTFKLDITHIFTNDGWKQFTNQNNKISFLIMSQENCYTEIENKINKPAFILEKKRDFFNEWSDWSPCTLKCKHKDNVRYRTRTCKEDTPYCPKSDIEEIIQCDDDSLPECSMEKPQVHKSGKSKNTVRLVLIIAVPVVLVIVFFIVMYFLFYKRMDGERELYENVAARYYYE